MKLRQWITSRRFRPIGLGIVGLIVIFGSQRTLLTFLHAQSLEDVSAWTLAKLFGVGFRQDLRGMSYLIGPLVPLLALPSNRTFTRRWFQITVACYVTAMLVFAFAVCLIDTFFFAARNARLNWQLPSYVGQGEILHHVWRTYPCVLLSAVAVGLIVGTFFLVGRHCAAGPKPTGPIWARLVYGTALTGMFLVWASGSQSDAEHADSQAYFSSNSLVSQLAFNPLLTGGEAVRDYLTEGDSEPEHYNLLSVPEAFAAAQGELAQHHTVFAGDQRNPLWRTIHTGRDKRPLNVVIIVMESFTGRYLGIHGATPSRTPFFDKLTAQGVYFSQMFAAGPRTSRALAAVLCGFPDLGGKSVLGRTRAQGTFQSLFGIFAERGYQTSFFYGGDSNFDNMRNFFASTGLENNVDLTQMPAEAWRTDWGVGDHVVFDRAHADFEAAEDPFFSVVLTLTNHNPHRIPPGCIEPIAGADPTVEAIRYADWALERFFRKAVRSDYFHDTVFVLVADHGPKYNPRRLVDVEGYRVPCLFYGPGVKGLEPRHVNTPCSQTDIGATVLSLLGGDFSHGMFGRDLLAVDSSDAGLALLRKDRCMALVRGNLVLIEIPLREPLLFRRNPRGEPVELNPTTIPASTANMHRAAMGFYQSARELYLRKAYGQKPD